MQNKLNHLHAFEVSTFSNKYLIIDLFNIIKLNKPGYH
jgi:hypothetical protein